MGGYCGLWRGVRGDGRSAARWKDWGRWVSLWFGFKAAGRFDLGLEGVGFEGG